MVNFCDLSEANKAIVCAARQACITLFTVDTLNNRTRHKGFNTYPAAELETARADRDTKVALALQTGLTLDQIEGRRSHND
jgi:hypothetical protein